MAGDELGRWSGKKEVDGHFAAYGCEFAVVKETDIRHILSLKVHNNSFVGRLL
jgi:hypothetical protein